MAEIEFLNIDLDIESSVDIAPIIEGFGKRVCVLNNEFSDGKFSATLETGYTEENRIISEYASMINGLSPEAREAWNNCIKREFNFGYDSGEQPNIYSSEISSDSIKALHDVGGSIIITIYGSNNEDR